MEPNILAELTIEITRNKQNIGWPVCLNYENIGLLSLNLKMLSLYLYILIIGLKSVNMLSILNK